MLYAVDQRQFAEMLTYMFKPNLSLQITLYRHHDCKRMWSFCASIVVDNTFFFPIDVTNQIRYCYINTNYNSTRSFRLIDTYNIHTHTVQSNYASYASNQNIKIFFETLDRLLLLFSMLTSF